MTFHLYSRTRFWQENDCDEEGVYWTVGCEDCRQTTRCASEDDCSDWQNNHECEVGDE